MKKIMWIVAMIPVVVTSVVLQFMPDVIPMIFSYVEKVKLSVSCCF